MQKFACMISLHLNDKIRFEKIINIWLKKKFSFNEYIADQILFRMAIQLRLPNSFSHKNNG